MYDEDYGVNRAMRGKRSHANVREKRPNPLLDKVCREEFSMAKGALKDFELWLSARVAGVPEETKDLDNWFSVEVIRINYAREKGL